MTLLGFQKMPAEQFMILTISFVLAVVLFFISAEERNTVQKVVALLISLCFSLAIYCWTSLHRP
ncbi:MULTISPECIES: hypothetical protein [Pseudacidovorax]|uniref:hypothetical protein n=1 Tax=Pseudacidovorax TaxID=433923 RepID=UPI001B22F18B|nr:MULTISPECIES: hypothetical protein [Pseudacidovorax]MBO9644331.1 hypothetical protein [Pseudacidovorax sp.]